MTKTNFIVFNLIHFTLNPLIFSYSQFHTLFYSTPLIQTKGLPKYHRTFFSLTLELIPQHEVVELISFNISTHKMVRK